VGVVSLDKFFSMRVGLFRAFVLSVCVSGSYSTTAPVDSQFQSALGFVKRTLPRTFENRAIRYTLHGLYKQATVGPCTELGNGRIPHNTSWHTWKAWSKLGDLPREDAQREYIRIVDGLRRGDV
jgi:acyl-CoA-binding protein